jgi:dTDP-4-amino-4,6-dideoxygalactose transaminase
MNKRIYLASPHMCGKEQEYVNEAFETNWIAPLGPHVNAFEKEIANYVGVKSAAALSSGTAGIHLALISLGIGEGDVVFCSSLTFSASCNPIIYQKATPVFIDSEPDSFNMSPIALEKAFKEHKPKAVIVVHLYGQSANMDKIKEICERHNVPIIEDAAESLGATYKGKMTGTFGKFGIYSFNGNKIITTSGGGMVVSDDEEAIEKIRFWATQARDPARHYQHSELGFNYRMSNVCAGIGRGQLTVLEKRIEQKKAIYNRYKEAFADIDEIEMMHICDFGKPNYWLSVITLKEDSKVKPLDIMVALEEENIESRPVWKPMHLQPFYKDYPFYNHNDKGISISEDIFNRGICLPSDTKMTDEDVDRIIDIIRKEFRK